MSYLRLSSVAACAIAAFACGESEPAPAQPPGFADGVALPIPIDENPDPTILEVTLVARVQDLELSAGTTTPAWTFNGTVPGPLLRLRAGDRLVVHFRNELPEDSSVHWHGIRLPNEMDGAPPHTQAPVSPGGTFDYDFVVPDPGLYWYHPHLSSAAQVGFGLYGAVLVEPTAPEPREMGDEVILVLSDMAIDEATGALLPPDSSGDLATLFGREGSVLLVNGRQRPTLHARSGLRQRWRLVNAARSRYFRVVLPGHTFERIGGDTGRLAEPQTSEELLIVPGGRADVIVRPVGNPGEVTTLTWLPFDRGWGTWEFREPSPLLDVVIEGETVAETALPSLGAGAEPLEQEGATPVHIRLTQSTDREGGLVLGIDGVPFWQAEPLMAHAGETQTWTITNEMAWAHPFHLHGFFFQELGPDGQLVEPLEWRDTANVPQLSEGRFVVRFDHRPGMWMFHCHILDHADAGMMGMIHVMH